MELGLQGRHAIVTGGSRGIGKAIARELAREGVVVAIVSRTKADLEWPAELQVKLPKPPADKTTAAPAAESAAPGAKTPDNNAAETKTPDAK